MWTSGIETEVSASESSAIQIRQFFVFEAFLKLWFILKCIDTFCSKTRRRSHIMRHLFSQKENATFKIVIFWNMGVGVDNFKLYDILVGKPRGNTKKCSLLKHYIICWIKISKISKRVPRQIRYLVFLYKPLYRSR